jgi:uncharacterized membrane protein
MSDVGMGPSAGSVAPPPEDLPPTVRSEAAWLLLVVVVTAYIVLTARWAVRNHDGFGTLGYDLGIFDQGVWLLSRFERPFITITGRHLFGDHTSFVLLPLAPVYRLVPSAKVLLVAQACALGLGAVPVFLIAREKLRHELLASGLAIAFLAHPTLASTGFEQFHPDAFEVPVLLFALWFMIRGRWRPFLASVVVLLLVKEDVAALTLALGIYVAVRHDRRIGLVTCGLSVAYVGVAVWILKPHWGVTGSFYAGRVPFGGIGGLVHTTVSHPRDLVRYLSRDGRPWYTWELLASFGLLSLLAPGLLVVAAGPFAANVLSTFSYQHEIRYHYGTLILPVLITAAIFGIARARTGRRRACLVAILTASALLSGFLWGPLPGARHPAYLADPSAAFAREARAAIRLIPADASVSAFYPFTTHLTHRARIYEFPNPFRAQWWGLGAQEGQRLPEADTVSYVILPKLGAYFTPEMYDVVQSLRDDFVTLFDSGNVTLLQRRPSPSPAPGTGGEEQSPGR